ncbi:Uncharacterized protein FWK35_00008969 [Aphis craccivora]|uniref:Uncharacterized protein n=1 Tax=Aphis craccivora TaxID=307492 RepID=A0A6G0Z2D1_APHCR|nr:Uncharacterized protein FWK35_00008969 [Aphis craccivora]
MFICRNELEYLILCKTTQGNFVLLILNILDSERSNECIDFTIIKTSRNNIPISKFGGDFRCKSEYPCCIIKVKSKHFPTVFKQIEKNKKKKK